MCNNNIIIFYVQLNSFILQQYSFFSESHMYEQSFNHFPRQYLSSSSLRRELRKIDNLIASESMYECNRNRKGYISSININKAPSVIARRSFNEVRRKKSHCEKKLHQNCYKVKRVSKWKCIFIKLIVMKMTLNLNGERVKLSHSL